jgi:hypothetical protein
MTPYGNETAWKRAQTFSGPTLAEWDPLCRWIPFRSNGLLTRTVACQCCFLTTCSSLIAARIKRSSAIPALLAADRDLLGRISNDDRSSCGQQYHQVKLVLQAHKRFIDRWQVVDFGASSIPDLLCRPSRCQRLSFECSGK